MDREFTEEQILELINRRRRQILVHSCMYYRMNTSIWSDKRFDRNARQLAALQNRYPEIAEKGIFKDAFRGFDATTGFDLPLDDPWVVRTALRIINYNKENKDEYIETT